MYFTTKTGQRILKKEAKEWIAEVQRIAADAVESQGWHMSEQEKVIMEIWTYWKDKRKSDVSNRDKISHDALEGIIYDNDHWLLPRHMDFNVDRENPRLELKIYRKEEFNVKH